MDLRLSLKRKCFEMTKEGIKTEDYRELTPYWIKRFTRNDINLNIDEIMQGLIDLSEGRDEDYVWDIYGFCLRLYDINTMTLGYPKSADTERILKYEHKGIEIRTGNPEWVAEEGKLYFVIKHGKLIE